MKKALWIIGGVAVAVAGVLVAKKMLAPKVIDVA